jgi:hypothetical protein
MEVRVTKNLLVVLALATLVAGCSRREPWRPAMMMRTPPATPAEASPPPGTGDIPDTQAFVRYDGSGYSILVPEGWSRTRSRSAVTFVWNEDAVTVWTSAPGETTTLLDRRYRDARGGNTRRTTIAGSPVTIVSSTSYSKPNPVTGKVLRLQVQAYLFSKNDRRTLLLLSAPAAADNVDQWKKISESFRWK